MNKLKQTNKHKNSNNNNKKPKPNQNKTKQQQQKKPHLIISLNVENALDKIQNYVKSLGGIRDIRHIPKCN